MIAVDATSAAGAIPVEPARNATPTTSRRQKAVSGSDRSRADVPVGAQPSPSLERISELDLANGVSAGSPRSTLDCGSPSRTRASRTDLQQRLRPGGDTRGCSLERGRVGLNENERAPSGLRAARPADAGARSAEHLYGIGLERIRFRLDDLRTPTSGSPLARRAGRSTSPMMSMPPADARATTARQRRSWGQSEPYRKLGRNAQLRLLRRCSTSVDRADRRWRPLCATWATSPSPALPRTPRSGSSPRPVARRMPVG